VAYAVVLRIANLIEGLLDHQFAYYGTGESGAAEELQQWATIHAGVSARLGAREMLSAARELAQSADGNEVEAALRSSRTFDFVVDPACGARQPIVPTVVPTRPRSAPDDSAFTTPRPLALGPAMRRIELDAFSAVNGGDVARDGDTLLVTCAARQWAFSAHCELGPPTIRGRGIVRVSVEIVTGELAVAVLVQGSSTAFAAPEHLHGPTDDPVDLLFPVNSVEECGAIVLRSSAPGGVTTRARLIGVAIHAPAPDRFDVR
jgi:hypothetical protein